MLSLALVLGLGLSLRTKSVLGPGLGLEGLVLGPVLGLETTVQSIALNSIHQCHWLLCSYSYNYRETASASTAGMVAANHPSVQTINFFLKTV